MLRQIHASKPQSLPATYHFSLLDLNSAMISRTCSLASSYKTRENFHICSSRRKYGGLRIKNLLGNTRVVNFSCGVSWKDSLRDYGLIVAKEFSSSGSQVVAEGNEKNLPWLAKYNAKYERKAEKVTTTKSRRSSWEESADKFLKGGRLEAGDISKKTDGGGVDSNMHEEEAIEDEQEGEVEVNDDPRWIKIRDRFDRFVEAKPGSERPEFKRWNRQESWGKKTWKDATESMLPKVFGEGVYGVGPVLAALSAERREFYALFVQEGLDQGAKSRKKKDKKGFEKVLKLANKVGLDTKVVSKHELNMISDNRPHQGLVLDASPLEMVGIKELEPVSVVEENGALWVALDEVTDPQNLGAIIRSAYFFGASGVVLCAKNSAPLSAVVSKSSAGSLEVMELRSCKNMMQFLTSSAQNGWRILGGAVNSAAVPLNEIVPGAPTILVLGSEGTGLRPLVERSCTQLIRIPGNAPVSVIAGEDENEEGSGVDLEFSVREFNSFLAVESLNVSVAAGILLHHLIGGSRGIKNEL